MGCAMSIEDVELVKRFLQEVDASGRFSKDVFEQCYLRDITQRGVIEKPEVSELWVKHYWSALTDIGIERLKRAARSDEKLAELLARGLGK